MSHILVSGLVNTETTVRVRQFPVQYYPIDYPFFGIHTAVSGVAFNIAKALTTLGDSVCLHSMTGPDFAGAYIRAELEKCGIPADGLQERLTQTPSSVVLFDPEGKRQIYCDLKDIQETPCGFDERILEGIDLVVACNINFNRPLLAAAKAAGKKIATDVHVLSDPHDDYNREFMAAADILFLSDERVWEDHHAFLWTLAHTYGNEIIVLGRGSRGAAIYIRGENRIFDLPARRVGEVVNTVGAGDALFSGFVHYYARGFAPLEALDRAQLFAAAKIRTNGASRGFLSEDEVEELCSGV